jgi:two-component system cell cycle sensor histidine kinase/response regulator CckA
MMSKLRILHLEDSPADCVLVAGMLSKDRIDCDITRCDNREKFVAALGKKNFDMIFADCTLPQFDGLDALDLARQSSPEIPFIFVSGTIEEESAIESLRCGATDYVLKHHLSRLVPAVRRAIAERDERIKNREMEEQLRQAQRLEAVGTLAGGIAHDFNNILSIIKGYTSLLPAECEKPHRVREIASIIDRASGRGSDLVSELMAFARRTDSKFSSMSINHRVRETVEMLRPTMPPNIVMELELAEGLPNMNADGGQIDRVIINLATNARDAMAPNAGKLTFTTSKVRGQEVPLSTAPVADQYVCLRITDTGSGMDEATRLRIFEPFFTTKPMGKGTGLGMPVVYGLVQSHSGSIDVQSSPGHGTSISLYFPVSVMAPERVKESKPEAAPLTDGTETVLLVDDEPDLRYFVEVMLNLHGYRVLSASDGEAALSQVRANEGIQILFSDEGLPLMDGFELSRRVRELNPNIKTILCSGYEDAKLKMKMQQEGIDGFIPKPYDAHALLQIIRTTLDKGRQPRV